MRPVLEYGAECWDPYREDQVIALDRVQKQVAKFANHTIDSVWENLALRRKIARICALLKRYTGERHGRLMTTGYFLGPSINCNKYS
jgi:hypothetical protein